MDAGTIETVIGTGIEIGVRAAEVKGGAGSFEPVNRASSVLIGSITLITKTAGRFPVTFRSEERSCPGESRELAHRIRGCWRKQ